MQFRVVFACCAAVLLFLSAFFLFVKAMMALQVVGRPRQSNNIENVHF